MSNNPDFLGPNEPEPTPEEVARAEAAINETAKELFSSLGDSDPMTEAWIGFHEFYRGLLGGGFAREDAIDITAAYLARIASQGM